SETPGGVLSLMLHINLSKDNLPINIDSGIGIGNGEDLSSSIMQRNPFSVSVRRSGWPAMPRRHRQIQLPIVWRVRQHPSRETWLLLPVQARYFARLYFL